MQWKNDFLGELLGTFLLVLFGCGSVAVSVLYNEYNGILQIGISWGIGVTLAIYVTRHLSCAHLNPAVSIGMTISGRMNFKKLPVYLSGQFIGAFLAAITLYLLYSSSIAHYESANSIIRGTNSSIETARIFGEFYQIPSKNKIVSLPLAMLAEGLGTFLLMLLILSLTEGCNVGRPDDAHIPVFIGLSVASIICLIAPITQAGLNPARDFSPRMVSWIFGWKNAAFPDNKGGFFWVYILAPILGSMVATIFFVRIIEPAMKKKLSCCNVKKN